MGRELKQKLTVADDASSSSDQEELEELGEGLLLESSDNPWMKHVSALYRICHILNVKDYSELIFKSIFTFSKLRYVHVWDNCHHCCVYALLG